jgi:hypothetical protein
LWKLLANAALEDLELTIAEKAFVRCGDYYGVQLVKQLSSMPDKMKARAGWRRQVSTMNPPPFTLFIWPS